MRVHVPEKKAAREAGETHYFTGLPCRNGHVAKRLTHNGSCVQCNVYSHRRWRLRNRRGGSDTFAAWQARYSDRWAAHRGAWDAKRRMTVPWSPTYDVRACVPFYAGARRLTRETGIRHDVAHIIPLCCGGVHDATNLRVLTHTENARLGRHLRKDTSFRAFRTEHIINGRQETSSGSSVGGLVDQSVP